MQNLPVSRKSIYMPAQTRKATVTMAANVVIRRFHRYTSALLMAGLIMGLTHAPLASADTDTSRPRVELQTSAGRIVLELNTQKAPKTVANFLQYIKDGYYEGTIFHRVIKGFMIQGGGYTADFTKKETREPIQNEADNGLKNLRGTIAMARTPRPHSATAQFFINHKDNASLNHRGKAWGGWGYAVFGKVIEGMDVVDKIASLPVGASGPFASDVPRTTVSIEHARLLP